MRTITLVKHFCFDFNGTVFQNGICLGDIDNDGDNELIVGNTNGQLTIFKHSNVWRKASNLGFITAVGTGDIFNMNRNVLIVISGDGWCYIFDINDGKDDGELFIEPTHTQRIPANGKNLLVGDVNGDGFYELVVGLSDRVVRTYQWTHGGDTVGDRPSGKLTCLNKWEFASQIGTISLNRNPDGSPSLLVAQPGGSYFLLHCRRYEQETIPAEEQWELLSKLSIAYQSLPLADINSNISSEILGTFKSNTSSEGKGSYYAILFEEKLILLQDEKIVWELQVDNHIFCLSKLDLTGDGNEELVACSWAGHTYIVSQEKEAVCFQFDMDISTFTAGSYAISEKENVPVFVYVTFDNKIFVYYDVDLSRGIRMKKIFDVLNEDAQINDLVNELHMDTKTIKEKNNLFSYCFYDLENFR